MKKLIILPCLIIVITSICTNYEAKNWKDCKNLPFDESEKGTGDSCCFFLMKEYNLTIQMCAPIFKDRVPEIIKAYKKINPDRKISIDCSSNWISYSLFLVALIFMF